MKTYSKKQLITIIVSSLVLAVMTLLIAYGKQKTTLYSNSLNNALSHLNPNQLILEKYDIPKDNSFYLPPDQLLPFESVDVDFINNNPNIENMYPYHIFSIGRFIHGTNGLLPFKINNQEIKIDKETLNDYIFPYYEDYSLEDSCTIYNNDVEGIILDAHIAHLLGIENTNGATITFTIYYPQDKTDNSIDLTNQNGETTTVSCIETIYNQKEITIPIKGILSKETVSYAECFGYLPYQYMTDLLNENWQPNVYTVFVKNQQKDNFISDINAYKETISIVSLSDQLIQQMAPIVSQESKNKPILYAFTIAALILVFIYAYTTIKKEQGTKQQRIYESGLYLIFTIMFSLMLGTVLKLKTYSVLIIFPIIFTAIYLGISLYMTNHNN